MTAAAALAENRDELAALCRMLSRGGGFRLGFVIVNHPSLRRRLAADCAAACGVTITEAELDPASDAGIVGQLERALGDSQPAAVFVHGLESMLDLRERQSPALDLLNLNRDYSWRRFRWPVVFVAPLFAVREFARQAPDFWSGRTGVYRLTGDGDDIRDTLDGLGLGYDWSLDVGSRQQRREVLEHLQRELADQDDADPALTAEMFSMLATAADFDHDYATSQALLGEALPVYQKIGNRLGEANTVQALGNIARMHNDYDQASEHYQQAQAVYREIGNRLGEANTVQALGDIAYVRDDYDQASEHYQQAQAVYREIGDRLGEANTRLAQARLAFVTGDRSTGNAALADAVRIYRAIGLDEFADRVAAELGDPTGP